MRIHSTSFLLELAIVYKSGREQVVEHTGNMPERVVIPMQFNQDDPATLKSVKLNGIYINDDKLSNVVKFQLSNRQWPEPDFNFNKPGDIILDFFATDPILYLLTIENTIS